MSDGTIHVMCVFTGPVGQVAKTRIFARHAMNGREVLAYAMRFAAGADVAMALPLPVPIGSAEDAVQWISLEGQEDFFDELDRAFPGPARSAVPAGPGMLRSPALAVHQVGAFEASFVPSSQDFGRLDPRFRLSPAVLQALPMYADWGFAVFQLRGEPSAVDVHPMALSFPRRNPRSLYFPTTHVHDGTVPTRALFDHVFYAQPEDAMAARVGWERSAGPAGDAIGPEAGIVVDLDRPLFRSGLGGLYANRDVTLETPVLEDPGALELRGRHHYLPLRVALVFEPGWRANARWRAVVEERLGPFAASLGAALEGLFAAHRERWGLADHAEALPLRDGYLPPGKMHPPGPCRRQFKAQGGDVEMQTLELAFANPPPVEVTIEIQRAFIDAMKTAVRS